MVFPNVPPKAADALPNSDPQPTTVAQTENPTPAKRSATQAGLDDKNDSGITPKLDEPIVNTMLLCLRDFTMNFVIHDVISTFVPSAQMMYFVIHKMDDIIGNNSYFTRQSASWHPLYTRLYYGILFYVQTFRVMKVMRSLSTDQALFLHQFESDFPFVDLPIAGPLVPFFTALCACKAPYPEYGFVGPRLPMLPGANIDNSQSIAEDIRCLLPNITGIIRGIHRSANLVNNIPQPYDWNLADTAPAAAQQAISAAAQSEIVRDARISPGTIRPITLNRRFLTTWAQSQQPISVPNVDDNADDMTWDDYLRLGTDTSWFSNLLTIMKSYVKYTKGSTTLEKIAPIDGHYSLCISNHTQVYPNQNAHRTAGTSEVRLPAVVRTATGDRQNPTEAVAALTQINWNPAENFAPVDPPQREGPWWNVSPDRQVSPERNPQNTLGSILADEIMIARPSTTNQ